MGISNIYNAVHRERQNASNTCESIQRTFCPDREKWAGRKSNTMSALLLNTGLFAQNAREGQQTL